MVALKQLCSSLQWNELIEYIFCLPLQARERVLRLSSSECVLKREVEEGRDALDKLAALNAALAEDKRDLNGQLQEVMLRGSEGATCRPEERSCRPFRPLCVCVFTDGTRAVRQPVGAAHPEIGGQLSAEGGENPQRGLQPAQVSVGS